MSRSNRRAYGRFRWKPSLGALLLLLAALAVGSASALTSDLASADITVSLRPDGKAEIFYTLEWRVSSGDMSGFYFQG